MFGGDEMIQLSTNTALIILSGLIFCFGILIYVSWKKHRKHLDEEKVSELVSEVEDDNQQEKEPPDL